MGRMSNHKGVIMYLSNRKNQITVCKGDTCFTVVGELAKVLAFVAIVAVAVRTAGELAKLLR